MAAALGAALCWQRMQMSRWTFPAMGFVAGFQAVMLVLAFLGIWALRPSLPDLMGTRYATRYDTAMIARHKDPVLCETLALCYWAGREPRSMPSASARRSSAASGPKAISPVCSMPKYFP